MKKVMILGAGEMQLPIIQKAVDLNIYTIVVDFDARAPGLAIADKKVVISTLEYEKIVVVAEKEKIDGILTTSDLPVTVVARVSEKLSLPAMSIDVATICTNKYLQREFFKNNGIKVPKFSIIEEESALKSIDYFPCVVKPVDSSASRGVKMVKNSEEMIGQYPISKEYSKQGKVIIEEFVPGREFSVETITQNDKTTIIAITEKILQRSEMGYFVEDCHIIPARISAKEYDLISEEVLNAIKVLKINNSPTHTEVKLNENGVFIIEIACRLGGDFITSDLVPLATGIDMMENLLDLALGKVVDLTPKWNKVAAIQFLNKQNYQKCLELINENEGLVIRSEIKEYHTKDIASSFDRMGYVIIQTNEVKEMEEVLDRLNTL